MEYQRKMYRIAVVSLLLGLVAATLGCQGSRARYGLLFREDLSAELWKFPDKSGGETASLENTEASVMKKACSEEKKCVAVCPEMPCPEMVCTQCPRLRWGARAESETVEPPPMIAPRFFPVPTRPVFTPRGDLSNLNPYIQRALPATDSELFQCDPETMLPELMPKGPVVLGPAPEHSTMSERYGSQYYPTPQTTSQPMSSGHWIFSEAPTKTKTGREKAFDLIATGSEVVR